VFSLKKSNNTKYYRTGINPQLFCFIKNNRFLDSSNEKNHIKKLTALALFLLKKLFEENINI
ncbi:hypothetical protein, partial [Enterococcus avium]|uniref:hypothetical protein n=1 Tax=Enterococcus avium TaxID=33945 RepID=UPI0022E64737